MTGCIRASNGTQASPHDAGAIVAEVKTYYDYLVADHPVQAIDNVYVDGVRQSGADFVFFPNSQGKALIRFFTMPTVIRQVNLGVTDTIAVVDGTSIVDGIVLLDGISINSNLTISDTTTITDAISIVDGINVSDNISVSASQASHGHTVGGVTGSTIAGSAPSYQANLYFFKPVSITFPTPAGATNFSYNITISAGIYGWAVLANGVTVLSGSTSGTWTFSSTASYLVLKATSLGGSTLVSATQHFTTTVSTSTANAGISAVKTGAASKTGAVTKTGTVSKTGSVTQSGNVTKVGAVTRTGSVSRLGSTSKTGTVTLTGNSVADTKIGGGHHCRCKGL